MVLPVFVVAFFLFFILFFFINFKHYESVSNIFHGHKLLSNDCFVTCL